ncbi:MAG: inositol monophosphatase [Chloroflexi bacterium]|nr:inositol monophosphatase [Chloroflexota bacterium]
MARVRQVGVTAARAAGELLESRVDSIQEIRHKGVVDLVTDVDVASEKLVCGTLRDAFPTHTILGEEGGAIAGSEPGYRWLVDPLDGTTNYTHGFPLFCVSIGFEVDGQLVFGAVYAPCQDELFVAERGRGATLNGRAIHVSDVTELRQALVATGFPYDRAALPRALRSFEVMSFASQAVRRVGSAALDLCYVACGRLDAYWEHQVKAWDLAAGALIVLEASGQLSATDGSAFSVDAGQVLSSNRRLHPLLVEALAGI